jgi:dTDP-4-amino-4,6-dideoxygalactose transaminase
MERARAGPRGLHARTIDPRLVAQAITPRTCAILGVHVFGNPCDAAGLEAIADAHGLPLLFDSAHALGSRYRERPVGSLGLAEVFSLGPSKLVCAGEGGAITTHDGDLARKLRHARDYGNPGTYDPLFAGINARMSEFHAAVGLPGLDDLERNVERREALFSTYRESLAGVRGIAFQEVLPGNRSARKDCILLIDEAEFGMPAETLQKALAAEGIDCRRYFDPPLHQQFLYRACRTVPAQGLPVTDSVARAALCPPFYSHLGAEEVGRVADAIGAVGANAAAVRSVLAEQERAPLGAERSALDEPDPVQTHEAA